MSSGTLKVAVDARSLCDLLDVLDTRCPGLRARVIDDRGLRRFVNVYVNDEDVRFAEGLATPLRSGDVVSIVAAIAGGA